MTTHEQTARHVGQAYERKDCRLCGSLDLELALPMVATPLADTYWGPDRLDEPQPCHSLDLWLCHACAHVQLPTVVDLESIFREYVYVTSSSAGLVDHFGRYADEVVTKVQPRADALVLEVGSNDGSLLRFFRDKGFRILGIDPAVEASRIANEAGVETLNDFFTSELARRIRENRGPASIFCANNVYAHIDDLGDVTDGIRICLADDGVFVFEVSYLPDIVDRMLFDTVYHEHLSYHSIKPLLPFLESHGMELFDVQRVPTKGGSIRGFAQPKGGPRPVAPIVAELLELEERTGMDRVETFRAYADRIHAARDAVLDVVREIKAGGGTVAGFGASHTVTTLLYQFELGDELEYLVDDNPKKQGTFSPGHRIPVLPSSTLVERRTDAVVLLAWQYADMFMAKNQEYAARGGKFVVPLPTVRVV